MEQTPVYDEKIINEQTEDYLWYEGNPDRLKNYYGQFCGGGIKESSMLSTKANYFWAKSSGKQNIKKIHSGLPAMVVDKLVQITLSDGYLITAEDKNNLKEVTLPNGEKEKVDNETNELLEEILDGGDIKFEDTLKEALTYTLPIGDGAFKIDADTDIYEYPIASYVDGRNVEYIYQRNKLVEIIFKTFYEEKKDKYCLYERRFVTTEIDEKENISNVSKIVYELYKLKEDKLDKRVPLSTLSDTKDLEDVTFKGLDKISAVPLVIYKGKCGRGKSIYKRKKDIFDAIDEVLSINSDAVRDSRTERYIPKDMLPISSSTGEVLMPDGFDNRYIATESMGMDDKGNKIQTVQPDIKFDGYEGSLKSFTYQALTGIVSPSTLGLDMAGKDNAEAQREREKTSVFTRTDIIRALENSVSTLCERMLEINDIMNTRPIGDYDVDVAFGEYASVSFEDKIETMARAKQSGILPNSEIIEELYGDTKSDEEKASLVEELNKETAPSMDFENLLPKE